MLASLNELCVRLVFLLYAEDAGVFGSHEMFGQYLRKFPASKYEREERELAAMLGIPYYREAPAEESGWTVSGVFKAIWFILEILMIPFAILGMRDGVQWFLGTGEHAKGRDDKW